MTTALIAGLAAAGLLGVTHAIEPDHVAGISALTSEYGDSKLSMLVGVCFGLGHAALVVGWVIVGYLVIGRSDYSAEYHNVGMIAVGVLLGGLAAAMTVRGLRRVVHDHPHEHESRVHSHPHTHLPFGNREAHEHGHGMKAYLKTGLVGALFTLSPPLSMIAFSSTLIPNFGPGAVVLAVCVYTITITGMMGLLGAGVGVVVGLAGDVDDRLRAASQVVAGIAVGAFAISLLYETIGPMV